MLCLLSVPCYEVARELLFRDIDEIDAYLASCSVLERYKSPWYIHKKLRRAYHQNTTASYL